MSESGTSLYDKLQETVGFLKERLGDRTPTVGLILGSGLGGFADKLANPIKIEYGEIPHYPVSTVVGHAGRLVVGDIAGVTCVAMQGRVHAYEGHPLSLVAFPARTLVALGAKTLVITNAAGGLRHNWEPGTLMLIRDHINLMGDNPLRGEHDDRFGARFPDMTFAYAPELRKRVQAVAQREGIELVEGVYVAMSGPTYETPTEVRMLATLGAHATGMSTIPEVIVANQMGAQVIGISCITNKAAGISDKPLSHDEVTETATRVRSTFQGLLEAILSELSQ
jgi:purine-nucleoside phosphorylase